MHTTGHAKRDELRLLQSVARPEWFVPIEGEYRMLQRHADLAVDMGLDDHKVLVVTDQVPNDIALVGAALRRVGFRVMKAVRDAARADILVAVHDFSDQLKRSGPNADVLGALEVEVTEAVERLLAGADDLSDLERRVRRTTGRFVGNRTRRRPPIHASVIITD